MKFHLEDAEIFVPDGLQAQKALHRTTHLAIGAHPDDLEIMASAAILECLHEKDRWFTGVVVTNGRDSPREGKYKQFADEEMRIVRRKEQKKAAVIGEYAALILLDYESNDVKGRGRQYVIDDLTAILQTIRPDVVFTHNLADKHDTHVAVGLCVIQAIRRLLKKDKPKKLFGCEVWRDLDWLLDDEKVVFDLSSHENLQVALLSVFDSQISSGKRYDLATIGRRRAHGTFFQSHSVDETRGLTFGMDLTPLILNSKLDVSEFVGAHIQRFYDDVMKRIKQVGMDCDE